MAFDVGSIEINSKGAVVATGNGGYGLGNKSLNVTSGIHVNRYAKVTAVNGHTVTIGTVSTSSYLPSACKNSFKVGEEILIHVAAYNGTQVNCSKRGLWKTAFIKSVSGSTLTLSKNVAGVVSGFNFNDLYVQVITIPHLKSVTLKSGGKITCPQFHKDLGYGGVIAFKCNTELVLDGGHIDLAGKGLDDYTLWNTGLVPNEPAAGNDAWRDDVTPNELFHTMAGLENYRTRGHLTLNYPDGAAFIVTKALVCDSAHASRIGYTGGAGVNRTRTGANGIIGGSSIFLAAETISGWANGDGVGVGAPFISKYPSSDTGNNRGMGRCYIATETIIPTDEGLYALDKISTPTRAADMFNLTCGFGNGKNAEYSDVAKQINSYAAVTAITKDGRTFTLDNLDTKGIVKFKKNALVFIHVTKKTYTQSTGRCMFATVQSYDSANKTLTIKDTQGFKGFHDGNYNLSRHNIQIITVPQFTNFNLNGKTYSKTPKYENGRGGIAVIVANDTCDLQGGVINVEGKGNSATSYGEVGLRFFGNAQMADRLPLGQGHGSVFILAKKLLMNSNTRIGATYSGRGQGGLNKDTNVSGGAIRAYPGQCFEGCDDIECGDEQDFYNVHKKDMSAVNKRIYLNFQGRYGGGKQPGYCFDSTGSNDTTKVYKGGYGSNADTASTRGTALQGAHVLIIADTIEGFCIDAIATGGEGGKYSSIFNNEQENSAGNGGASHGGAGVSDIRGEYRGGNGGFIGGGGGHNLPSASGGGSGGFAFVYCNHAVDQDTSNIKFD